MIFFVAMLGGAIGSFLNVVIWRVPEGMSLIHPGSHCPKCGHAIRFYDNLPVFGWIFLRGRCRDCHAPISPRYPLIETICFCLTGLLFYAFMFQGWTLPESCPLHWSGMQEWLKTTHDMSLSRSAGQPVLSEFDALIDVMQFQSIWWKTCFLTFLFLALFFLLLVLGFVEWDHNSVPKSLLIACWILLGIGIVTAGQSVLSGSGEQDENSVETFFLTLIRVLGTAFVLGSVFCSMLPKARWPECLTLVFLFDFFWGIDLFSGVDSLLPGAASPFPPLLLLIIAIVLTLVIYKMKKRFLPGMILFLFSLLIFLEYCRG